MYAISAIIWLGIVSLLLAGCSNKSPSMPGQQATGYMDDSGSVKIWRQDDRQNQPIEISTIATSYRQEEKTRSYYRYQQGKPIEVSKQQVAPDPVRIQLRFDAKGEVIYMQRQQKGRNALLTQDEIENLRYESRNLIKLTEALRAGEVRLLQGRWQNGKVTTCEGQQLKPVLEENQLHKVAQQAQAASTPINISWLEKPGGNQLLQIATEDLCQEQKSVMH